MTTLKRAGEPFVFGNRKLPATTAVLNVTPALLCPSRMLGLCQLRDPERECYAISEEKRYFANCIPSRMRMMEHWDRSTGESLAEQLVSVGERRKAGVKALRIGECGDFRHQADVEKAEALAAALARNAIRCYCYTARRDLDFTGCASLVVNGSGWMAHNRFCAGYGMDKTVLNENGQATAWLTTCQDKAGNRIELDTTCPGNCRGCDICSHRHGGIVGVAMH